MRRCDDVLNWILVDGAYHIVLRQASPKVFESLTATVAPVDNIHVRDETFCAKIDHPPRLSNPIFSMRAATHREGAFCVAIDGMHRILFVVGRTLGCRHHQRQILCGCEEIMVHNGQCKHLDWSLFVLPSFLAR